MQSEYIIVTIMGKDYTLAEIQADVTAARKKFDTYDFCFTAATVQGLIDTIISKDDHINELNDTIWEFWQRI